MKLGTVVRLPDGREGTVVFNSLIGVGISWGVHYPPPEDFEGSSGDLVQWTPPDGFRWRPDALLRDPWRGCEACGFKETECVGEKYEVVGKAEVSDGE